MRTNFFGSAISNGNGIEPHLPTDVVWGVERADDRRVISGIVHLLKSWMSLVRFARPNMVRRQLSISAWHDGGWSAAIGKIYSRELCRATAMH